MKTISEHLFCFLIWIYYIAKFILFPASIDPKNRLYFVIHQTMGFLLFLTNPLICFCPSGPCFFPLLGELAWLTVPLPARADLLLIFSPASPNLLSCLSAVFHCLLLLPTLLECRGVLIVLCPPVLMCRGVLSELYPPLMLLCRGVLINETA